MLKYSWLLAFSLVLILIYSLTPVFVQAAPNPEVQGITDFISNSDDASESASSTDSGTLATPSAEITQRIQDKTEQDITQPTETQKSKLVTFLEEKPIGQLSWHNFLQYAIRSAVNKGLPANIVVLILLFPVITSFIAISRHIIGLKGFGIYSPAVLSVALVSSGIGTGMVFFVTVLTTVGLARSLVKKLKLPYLPRTAMLLWGVSLVILALLLIAAHFQALFSLLTINIFPLLIIMLLTENFIESQQFSSQKEAIRLTLETVFISVMCSFFISLEIVQKTVILNPELTVLNVALLNYVVGMYSGLRLTEYFRFYNLLDR